jgi:hypothetical protein
MPDLLTELNQRYPKPPEPPLWKTLLRFLLSTAAAIVVITALRMLLLYFGINPFHIFDTDW